MGADDFGKKKALASPEGLQLRNKATSLEAEEEPGILSRKVSEACKPLNHAGPSRGQDEEASDSSGHQGTETPTCQPDLLTTDVCCFLGYRAEVLWRD